MKFLCRLGFHNTQHRYVVRPGIFLTEMSFGCSEIFCSRCGKVLDIVVIWPVVKLDG